ncbi:helix-turn-helix domain-containing protein [bacterium]|nr:helix-turn-helix domain-containing protein [bacterium]
MNGMTVSDAAVELGVSVPRIYALVRNGRLEAERFGRRMLVINEQSVKNFTRLPAGRPRKSA